MKDKLLTNIKWVRAYLECLFEHRQVHVFKQEEKQLQLFLW